ncbi:unnamed protein product [Owenia fusiformis]|uniref:VWFD domain-containing protein n=1 Tax=Owenia fusiformis TaxID=6347 RepID=A0A8S4PZK9_OWEFU|nr:unnamed protein product [Owenia fusiformis]
MSPIGILSFLACFLVHASQAKRISIANYGSATCRSQGEVHYWSLDGLGYHHQCDCKYLLLGSTVRTRTPFKVLSKNWYLPGDQIKRASWTKYVEVVLRKLTIRLGQDKKVTLKTGLFSASVTGDFEIRLPLYGLIKINFGGKECADVMPIIKPVLREDALRVDFRPPPLPKCWSSRFVTVEVPSIGLKVEFDGFADARVTLSKFWMSKVNGLCQNFDGDAKNDWRMRDGTNVAGLENPGTMIGNSYQVFDPEDPKCQPCSLPDLPWMVFNGGLRREPMFAEFAKAAEDANTDCDITRICGEEYVRNTDAGTIKFLRESCQNDLTLAPSERKCNIERTIAETCGNDDFTCEE